MNVDLLGDYVFRVSKISGSKRLIIALGDSWTRGEGECTTDKEIFRNSFPYVISEKLNADLINLGKGGASNQYMLDSLMFQMAKIGEMREKYDEIIVIATYTTIHRTNEFYNGESSYEDINFIDIPKLRDSRPMHYGYYLEDACNDNKYTAQTLRVILGIESLCRAHGLKYISGNAFGPFLDVFTDEHHPLKGTPFYYNFKPLYNQVNHYKSLTSRWGTGGDNLLAHLHYHGNNNFGDAMHYISECLHPTTEGYQLIANAYCDFIAEKYDIFY